jgi:hypothetical protein
MKQFFSSIVAALALAALSGCGGTSNAAMPYTTAPSHPQTLHPHSVYHFWFANNTGQHFYVTRSDVSCMSEPPPATFTLGPGEQRDYNIDTRCLLDPSTFRLAFVAPYTHIAAVYTKETGKPWRVTLSDVHLLNLDFDAKSTGYWTSISLKR